MTQAVTLPDGQVVIGPKPSEFLGPGKNVVGLWITTMRTPFGESRVLEVAALSNVFTPHKRRTHLFSFGLN